MALKEPYVTVLEADVYLANSTDWSAATTEQKEDALYWGRVYMDSTYVCPYLDEDNPSDEIKYANSLLGEDYIQGNLLPSDGSKPPRIEKQRDQAGSVETEVEYQGGYKQNYQQDVDALLFGQCSKSGNGITVQLVRA